ncbi:MAG: cytochrome-c oxidase, cbb3-type subunit III [Pseudomonadota bacterium]
MSEKEIDVATGVETTGHEWDGVKELNNPLPRWWLNIFYASIVWAVVYWVFMPAWPGITGHTKGVRDHSERKNVAAAMETLDAERAASMDRLLAATSVEVIEKDPELLEFTMAAGSSLFGDNCATCHGAGGQGYPGYPSLIDDSWIWGGTLDAIQTTLRHGIRAENPETRINIMQAFGRDGLLTNDQITDLMEYVVHISGREANLEAVERAAPLFAQQCTTCHGADGKGDQAQGAPNLTDAIWLYGGDRAAIRETLYFGRAGVMPYWSERLTEPQIAALAVYVHSLGGGE